MMSQCACLTVALMSETPRERRARLRERRRKQRRKELISREREYGCFESLLLMLEDKMSEMREELEDAEAPDFYPDIYMLMDWDNAAGWMDIAAREVREEMAFERYRQLKDNLIAMRQVADEMRDEGQYYHVGIGNCLSRCIMLRNHVQWKHNIVRLFKELRGI